MYKKYRFDSSAGNLRKYSAEHDTYIWVARSSKQTAAEAVKEYEAGQHTKTCCPGS